VKNEDRLGIFTYDPVQGGAAGLSEAEQRGFLGRSSRFRPQTWPTCGCPSPGSGCRQ
jgi:hypothetical protein